MYHARLRFCHKTSGHGSKILPSSFLTQETCCGKFIHLAHPSGPPQKRNFLNKAFLILTQKKSFKRKMFSNLFERIVHLTQSAVQLQKRNFYQEIYYKLTQNKPQLFTRKNFDTWKYNQIRHFLWLSEKFFSKQKFSCFTCQQNLTGFLTN